jgi:anionic cell wall polymer biosynthesis LytR-Cps2A-Psr (LCP) family protein
MNPAKFMSKKKIGVAIISAIITFTFITGGYFSLARKNNNSDKSFSENVIGTSVEQNPTADPQILKNAKTLGVLLLGYGGAGHQGGYLTDVIQILYVDFDKKIVSLVSIPRDLWVNFSQNKSAKINEMLVLGADKKQDLVISGATNAKTIISEITGLNINYFMAIDFVGLDRTIGYELKGIEVKVSETLDDPWYPIKGEEVNTCGKTLEEVTALTAKYSGFELEKQFPCRYEHLLFHKGISRMQGAEVIKYVRSRHGSGDGDISRSRRQQEVLQAIGNKLFSLNFLDNLPNFYNQLLKHIKTDLSIDALQFLVPLLKISKEFRIIKINLSTTNVLNSNNISGQSAFIPKEGINNWKGVQTYIQGQLQ